MKRFVIGPNDTGQRLDKFLGKAAPLLPKSLLYKSIRQKRIKRDGRRCTAGDKLSPGDVVELYLNDEFFAPRELPFLAAPKEIRVVYEDENILLADKPAGLLVHEDAGGEADTLIARIQHHLYSRGEYDPARENSFAPALCNRIDRNTGGIVIAAKNFESLQIMSEKIKMREITKRYLCAVRGVPSPAEALLTGYHTKDSHSNTVRITTAPREGAKTALTRYRVLASREGHSLVEVELLTGRTHQIRAHMASIGHPLLGDAKYGKKEPGMRFQALCSYKLIFSFSTPAGGLDYLKGREFTVCSVPFLAPLGYRDTIPGPL